MKKFIVVFIILSLNSYARDCAINDIGAFETIESLFDQSGSLTNNLIPLDHIGNDLDIRSRSQAMMGFGYYIGGGNERYEKLEGYDNVYLMIDEYVAVNHPLNNMMHGSHAVVKWDPVKKEMTYLLKSKQVSNESVEVANLYPSVNESLCSLNSKCNKSLTVFNSIIDSGDFDDKIVGQYTENAISAIKDKLIVDIYHKAPVVSKAIDKVLIDAKKLNSSSIKQVNKFIKDGITKIRKDEIGDMDYYQYKAHLKATGSNKKAIDYYYYSGLVSNLNIKLAREERKSIKKAVYTYCANNSASDACEKVNNTKAYMDYFNSKRVQVPSFDFLEPNN